MCGITGIVSPFQTPPLDVLQRMTATISHRGPDDTGFFVEPGVGFGHRRLSVIDLSDRGHQPMANDAQTLWIAYNGEVYNYIEIRRNLLARGYSFKSDSDTEVILHAYEEFGEDCLQLFKGMFALAIWDSVKKRFFAARDRVGIKPFYYYFDGKTLVFGSEIKALLQHPAVNAQPDEEAIRRYLLFGNTMSDQTWYSCIKSLPPGCWLSLENGRLKIQKYWDIKYEPDYSRSYESLSEELLSLLEDAIALHLRSDVPVGAYLSGGIDSSSIVSLATPMLPGGIHTFSAAFAEGPEYDERAYINVISKTFATHHHEVIPSPRDLPHLLPKLLWHLDEPVIGAAILPMYRVCELVAKSGVKVVNGGQGGDELFGGYPPFYVTAVRNIMATLKTGPWSADLAMELLCSPSYLCKGGAMSRLYSRFVPAKSGIQWLRGGDDTRKHVGDIWSNVLVDSPASNAFDEMAYLSLKYFLPGLLQQEDRMSMAWSIESRVPLLDYRIVEFSGRVPSWMKVRRGVLKSILRRAVRGTVPDVILGRKDKKGYPTPSGKWFAGELSGYLRETLCGGRLYSESLVDPAAVAEMVKCHTEGSMDYGAVLWNILNLELWMRGIVDGWKGVEMSNK